MPICKHPLCNCLCNGALPCPSQPIQPVNWGFVKVPCPELNLIQDTSAGSLETTFSASMPIFSSISTTDVVENICINYQWFASGICHQKQEMF